MTKNEIKKNIVTVRKAAEIFRKKAHSIRYLVRYNDEINRYDKFGNLVLSNAANKLIYVSITELEVYFRKYSKMKAESVEKLSINNPELEFAHLSDAERTKHVHILHPYVGKFIPQLAEYYLKKKFRHGQWILDPFVGSGTTLVEANVLGINSIGIDISAFNCAITRAKTAFYDTKTMNREVIDILRKVSHFSYKNWKDPKAKQFLEKNDSRFDNRNEKQKTLEEFFGQINLKKKKNPLKHLNPEELIKSSSDYIKLWFAKRTIAELQYYALLIPNYQYKDLLMMIASRAARSSRMIKHSDLARPKKPLKEGEEYFCEKHRRLCRPIDQALKHLRNYSISNRGAIKRIEEYRKLKTPKKTIVIEGNSENINLIQELENIGSKVEKLDGILTSPPYVGVVDYHNQHKYAYELFPELKWRAKEEIGPLSVGRTKKAQELYLKSMVRTLQNFKPLLKQNALVILIANDKFNLYPKITELAGFTILKIDSRPVYKRATMGGARSSYAELIFHLKPE